MTAEKETITLEKKLTVERSFIAEPTGIKRKKRGHFLVKEKATELMQSFYPDNDIPYEAVRTRMARLGIGADKATVVAYLGRPQYDRVERLDQRVQYPRTGTTIPKIHTFRRVLPAKRGYIEIFDLGYCYPDKNGWVIHWNYAVQTELPISSQSEWCSRKVSNENFSLSPKCLSEQAKDLVDSPNENTCGDREERECISEREKNLTIAVNTAKRNTLGQFNNTESNPQ